MAALLRDAIAENAAEGLADGERRACRVGRVGDASEVALDGLETSLQEAADVSFVSYGECHRGFRGLALVGAGESTNDESPVVSRVVP